MAQPWQQVVLEEYIQAERAARGRVAQLTDHLLRALPEWSLAPQVEQERLDLVVDPEALQYREAHGEQWHEREEGRVDHAGGPQPELPDRQVPRDQISALDGPQNPALRRRQGPWGCVGQSSAWAHPTSDACILGGPPEAGPGRSRTTGIRVAPLTQSGLAIAALPPTAT